MINLKFKAIVLAASAVCTVGAQAAETITAAGATFPYPIYSKWFQQYKEKTGTEINYASIGSGGGIKQLTEGTVDFGASDKPMSDEQIGKLKVKALHFPTVMGAVVPVYNIEGVSKELNFTGEALSGIFMGSIKSGTIPPSQVRIPEPSFPTSRSSSSSVPTPAVQASSLLISSRRSALISKAKSVPIQPSSGPPVCAARGMKAFPV